jgi:hypothetical protein
MGEKQEDHRRASKTHVGNKGEINARRTTKVQMQTRLEVFREWAIQVVQAVWDSDHQEIPN